MAYYLYKRQGRNKYIRYEPMTGQCVQVTSALRADPLSFVQRFPTQPHEGYERDAETRRQLARVRRHAVPIAPQDGLFLEPMSGPSTKLERRFAELFTETWFRFPSKIRKMLKRYWSLECPHRDEAEINNLGSKGDFNLLIPRIQLVKDWAGCEDIFAQVSLLGFLIRFRAESTADMPDHLVRHIVAHELMHVVLYCDPQVTEDLEYEVEEATVEKNIKSLGFTDGDEFDEWIARWFSQWTRRKQKLAREIEREFRGLR